MLTLRTTATVTKINRKSSSPCFKDLKIGDVIEFSVPTKTAKASVLFIFYQDCLMGWIILLHKLLLSNS